MTGLVQTTSEAKRSRSSSHELSSLPDGRGTAYSNGWHYVFLIYFLYYQIIIEHAHEKNSLIEFYLQWCYLPAQIWQLQGWQFYDILTVLACCIIIVWFIISLFSDFDYVICTIRNSAIIWYIIYPFMDFCSWVRPIMCLCTALLLPLRFGWLLVSLYEEDFLNIFL